MEDREWSEQQKLKKEKYVAEWVLKHRKRAGAGTGNFPGAGMPLSDGRCK